MKHLRLILSLGVLASILNCKSATPEPIATVDTPTFSPPGGNYTSDQVVTISCATPGAAIHYTTDGATPTASSALYAAPITVAGNGTSVAIRAIAVKAGMTDSSVASASYTIAYSQVAQPTFNPPGGNYSSDQSVAISCATPGAAIHYTTDGTRPTGISPLYAGPVVVAGHGANVTIRAIATRTGMLDSSEASASYVVTYLAVAQPTFAPAEGTYPKNQSVAIDCATPGAAIHYTTDGSVPTGNSPLYIVSIPVTGMGTTITIRAIATKAGMLDSPTAAATYYIKILSRYVSIALAGAPNDVVYDSSRGHAYVSNRTLNRIEVVNVQTRAVESQIPVGGSPRGLAISPDGQSLLVTIFDAWKMSRIDLNTRSQVTTIDLPPHGYGYGPLRVDFDASGTCIWRDATEAHAFGNAYTLDLASGTSTRLMAAEAEMRYAPSFDSTRFLFMINGGKASVWSSASQSSSVPVSIQGFGSGWADWMNQGAIDNSREVILLALLGSTRVYDSDFSYLGSTFGMAWGTFGPWRSLALLVPGEPYEVSSKVVNLVNISTLEIVDSLALPENIGYVEYNYGGQPIFLTADAKQLFVVGQTALFVIDTSTVAE